jgi:hypothetical protein
MLRRDGLARGAARSTASLPGWVPHHPQPRRGRAKPRSRPQPGAIGVPTAVARAAYRVSMSSSRQREMPSFDPRGSSCGPSYWARHRSQTATRDRHCKSALCRPPHRVGPWRHFGIARAVGTPSNGIHLGGISARLRLDLLRWLILQQLVACNDGLCAEKRQRCVCLEKNVFLRYITEWACGSVRAAKCMRRAGSRPPTTLRQPAQAIECGSTAGGSCCPRAASGRDHQWPLEASDQCK